MSSTNAPSTVSSTATPPLGGGRAAGVLFRARFFPPLGLQIIENKSSRNLRALHGLRESAAQGIGECGLPLVVYRPIVPKETSI
jgi:hypothetical protein